MKNNSVEEITEKLKNCRVAAIFCHVRPDGDTLGSGLALCAALRKAGKSAHVFCEDPVPEKFHFLPAAKTVKSQLSDDNFDILITVDCADIQRRSRSIFQSSGAPP